MRQNSCLFFTIGGENICLLRRKSAKFALSFGNGCVNTFDLPKSDKLTHFSRLIFEMYDFCLNWLREYTPILPKHFFFLFQLIFWNTQFFVIAFANTQLFRQQSSNFVLFHYWLLKKWDFFIVDFFKCVICYVNIQLFHLKFVKFASLHDLF